MCDPRVALAVVVACGLAPAATGQVPVESATRLARLERYRDSVASVTVRADSLRRAANPADTVRIGALVILAPQRVASLARAGGAIAWEWIAATFGEAAAALTPYQFVLQGLGGPDLVPALPATRVRTITIAPWLSDSAVAFSLAIPASMVMSEARDSAFARWLRRPLNPRPGAVNRLLEDVYLELTVQPWQVVRSCQAGDLTACGHALGLAAEGDGLDEWYTGEERRVFVMRREGRSRAVGGREYEACVNGRDVTACTTVMQRISPEFLPPPLSPGAREALVHLALDLGEPGGYERLLHTHGSMEQRLAAAAGVASDSLLRVWRDAVDAHRPKPVTLQASRAWAAFLWAGVLALLGLRSTRWR